LPARYYPVRIFSGRGFDAAQLEHFAPPIFSEALNPLFIAPQILQAASNFSPYERCALEESSHT
jgi:hypothetical protein